MSDNKQAPTNTNPAALAFWERDAVDATEWGGVSYPSPRDALRYAAEMFLCNGENTVEDVKEAESLVATDVDAAMWWGEPMMGEDGCLLDGDDIDNMEPKWSLHEVRRMLCIVCAERYADNKAQESNN